jgi:hypothetical protein
MVSPTAARVAPTGAPPAQPSAPPSRTVFCLNCGCSPALLDDRAACAAPRAVSIPTSRTERAPAPRRGGGSTQGVAA